MNESKGKEEQVKQQEGRKKRGWGSQPMVSNEVYNWAKKKSRIGEETNKAGYYHKKY